MAQSIISLPRINSVAFGAKQTWTELHSRNQIHVHGLVRIAVISMKPEIGRPRLSKTRSRLSSPRYHVVRATGAPAGATLRLNTSRSACMTVIASTMIAMPWCASANEIGT